MKGKIEFQFTATIWQYSSLKGSWVFVSLPMEISNEIRENLKLEINLNLGIISLVSINFC
jgi:hypothetical protein